MLTGGFGADHADLGEGAARLVAKRALDPLRQLDQGRAARAVQAERFTRLREQALRTNAEAEGELLDRIATPDSAGRELLLRATERLQLTARGYHRVLRVARTIADLDGEPQIDRAHIAEALSFRRMAPDRR